VVEYTGSRRDREPLSAASQQRLFADDDAARTCPECGAGVRPDQEWCTLCLHVLRAPEPPPLASVVPAGAAGASLEAEPAGPADPVELAAAAADRARAEAAATALLEQLAIDSRKDRLVLPSYLDTKPKVAVACAVAMSGLTGIVLVGMSILGAILH
jgi:rubredoxin